MTASIIQAEGVWKTYGAGGSRQVDALRNISLEIERGTCTAIAGPSGSGKTTLLSILGLLTRPSRGRLLIDGEEVSQVSEVFRTRVRRENIGFVFQAQYLIPRLTAVENVAIPQLCTDVSRREAEAAAEKILVQLGLESRAEFPVEQLSGGEQQRVSIARGLINSPRVLIADEPSASMDDALISELLSLLREMSSQRGMTVVVASHDSRVLDWSDTVYSLRSGELAEKR